MPRLSALKFDANPTPGSMTATLQLPAHTGNLGPFLSGTRLYAFMIDTASSVGTVTGVCVAQDTTNAPDNTNFVLDDMDVVQDGSTFHIAFADSASVIHYARFDASTDSWVEADNYGGSAGNYYYTVYSPTDVPSAGYCSIVRRSDGDIIIAHSGEYPTAKGGQWEEVLYSRLESTTWTTGVTVADSGTKNQHNRQPVVVMGSSNQCHIGYMYSEVGIGTGDAANRFKIRALSSGNALRTERTASTFELNTSVERGFAYTRSSTESIVFYGIGSTTPVPIRITFDHFTDDSSPTFTQDVVRSSQTLSMGNTAAMFDADDADHTHYFLHRNSNNNDLFLSDDQGGTVWDHTRSVLYVGSIRQVTGTIQDWENARQVVYIQEESSNATRYGEYSLYSLSTDPDPLDATVQTYTLAGVNAGLTAQLNATVGTYTLTGVAATFQRDLALDATTQTYTLTGVDAALTAQLNATIGTFALTGVDATLTKLRTLDATTQTYALTGVDATFQRSEVLEATTQTYALTGVDATFQRTEVLETTAQTYTLTGVDAELTKTLALDATTQTYALTGVDATFQRSEVLEATTQTYALTGVDAALQRSLVLDATTQTYALTGVDAALTAQLNATVGTYTLTGVDATFQRDLALDATTQTYTLTNISAGLETAGNLDALQGIFTLTGVAATFQRDLALDATTQTYALTGVDAALTAQLNATVGTYTLTGVDATFQRDLALDATTQTYALTGVDAALTAQLNATVGTYTLTGVAATFQRDLALDATTQTYSLTGVTAALDGPRELRDESYNLLLDQGSFELVADGAEIIDGFVGTFTLTGVDATLQRSLVLEATTQTYALTGVDVTFASGLALDATTQTYALTGVDATFQRDLALDATTQAYALTGVDTELTKTRVIDATTQTYALTGVTAALELAGELEALVGTFALSGNAVQLEVKRHLRPSSTPIAGGWTTQAAGGDLHNSVDEVTPSDTDYIQSQDNVRPDLAQLHLSDPAVPVDLNKIMAVNYRFKVDVTDAADLIIKLKQGSTTLAETQESFVSTNYVSGTLSVPAGTVGQPDDLRIELEAVDPFEWVDATEAITTVGSSTWTVPAGVTNLEEVIIVAGGGGGGSGTYGGGGGGGGGVLVLTDVAVTPGQQISYTVGAGGAGGAQGGDNRGTNGSNSVFNSQTAIGGGGGGAADSATLKDGLNGGSGGGGGNEYNNATTGTGGTGTASQGFAGGTAYNLTTSWFFAAGGGGAGGAGSDPGSGGYGHGGIGKFVSDVFVIYGEGGLFGGGGAGGVDVGNVKPSGHAGHGGGGDPGSAYLANTPRYGAGNDGLAGMGGGGGGSSSDTQYTKYAGGDGSSGGIYIRYGSDGTTGGTAQTLTWTDDHNSASNIYSNFYASARGFVRTSALNSGWYGVTNRTEGKTSGKHYFELIYPGQDEVRGVAAGLLLNEIWPAGRLDLDPKGYYRYVMFNDGQIGDGAETAGGSLSAYGDAWVAGDRIGVAADFSALTLRFYVNGVDQGVSHSLTAADEYTPFVSGLPRTSLLRAEKALYLPSGFSVW